MVREQPGKPLIYVRVSPKDPEPSFQPVKEKGNPDEMMGGDRNERQATPGVDLSCLMSSHGSSFTLRHCV